MLSYFHHLLLQQRPEWFDILVPATMVILPSTQLPNEKKRSVEGDQTLRACCSKAEPKIFAPPQTPFPRAQDGQNLISWRWSLYLYLQTQFGEDRWTQFRFIVVTEPHTHTHKHTHKQTHRQDRLQYTAPQPASAQYKNRKNGSHSEQEIYYLYRVQIGDKSVQASIYRLRIDLRFEFFFLKHRGCF